MPFGWSVSCGQFDPDQTTAAARRRIVNDRVESPDPAVAQVVHDLRNQLAVILSCAEWLASVSISNDEGETISELRAAAQRASLLSRQIVSRHVRHHPTDDSST